MADFSLNAPRPGSVVEFLQGNKVHLAFVTEEAGGKLKLLTETRREAKLPAARVMPWVGPKHDPASSREAIGHLLTEHAARRETLAAELDVLEIWELAQGEVARGTVAFFAELAFASPDADQLAAVGRALLAHKTHFKFQPPDFEIYDAERVETRIREAEEAAEREKVAGEAVRLFTELNEIRHGRSKAVSREPEPELRELLATLLHAVMAGTLDAKQSQVWEAGKKGLPPRDAALAESAGDEVLAFHLAQAWGIVGPHHNYLLQAADYDIGEDWTAPYAEEIARLVALAGENELPLAPEPFVAVDGATTEDRDDALFAEELSDGSFRVAVALACPALGWRFGSALDQTVANRGTSLYLPEATGHMLPRALSTDAYSLNAGAPRPALVVRAVLSSDGELSNVAWSLERVEIAANRVYPEAEAAIEDPASHPHGPLLAAAHQAAAAYRQARIASGAVVIVRPDPEVTLAEDEAGNVTVTIELKPETPKAQVAVSELMILANAAASAWAAERDIALAHRTQDIALPRATAGVWDAPEDIYRAVKALGASILEAEPKRHASLGVPGYAPISSPLRRYADLINCAQIASFLTSGAPALSKAELDEQLPLLSARLEAVSKVQRFRPRYWKLLWLKQQGPDVWHQAVVVEDCNVFIMAALPKLQIFARGRKKLFGEKALPGMAFELRLGKVDPLANEFQTLEAREY